MQHQQSFDKIKASKGVVRPMLGMSTRADQVYVEREKVSK